MEREQSSFDKTWRWGFLEHSQYIDGIDIATLPSEIQHAVVSVAGNESTGDGHAVSVRAPFDVREDAPAPTPAPLDVVSASLRLHLREVENLSVLDVAQVNVPVAEGAPAAQRLVAAHLPLVVEIAKRYTWLGVPLEDLIQEGNLHLLIAAQKYCDEPHHHSAFKPYATVWIWQGIVRAIGAESSPIAIPTGMHEDQRKLSRYCRRHGHADGSEITLEEAYAALGTCRYSLADIQWAGSLAVMSADLPLGAGTAGEELTFADALPDLAADTAAAASISVERSELFAIMQKKLSVQEREILALYYGLIDDRAWEYQEIAELLRITPQTVSVREKGAIWKLRHFSGIQRLSASGAS